MKLLWLFFTAAPLLALNAQTDPPAPDISAAKTAALAATSTNAVPREQSPIVIEAEHGDFDLKNRIGIYSGNVRVTDTNPPMKLTCEVLTASMPTNANRIDNIIAERNVRIEGMDKKGRALHAVSDKAVYAYQVANSVTNETITLTGNVFVDSAMFKGTGDPLVWDRINDSIHGKNMKMEISEIKLGTNAPAAKPEEK